jgi:pimeloyl-ACP methyl ester carboxylesterase
LTDKAPIPSRSAVRSTDGTSIAYQSLGDGEGVIVLGGAMQTGEDYLAFAGVLARSFAVHLVDRRGRGASGPQGSNYSIEKECEDLIALQAATGAVALFGHSYGGLVALETARRASVFRRIAVYEPGVSIGGSIPAAWLPRYRDLLASGDKRGAFACMVRGAGFAPSPIVKMPLWYVRAILRLVIRGQQWQRLEPLLESHLAEHEEVARLDDGTADRFRPISARLLLMGGRKSPTFITTDLFRVLQQAIGGSVIELFDGLGHTAPDEKAPERIAERMLRFLQGPTESRETRAADRVR